jgi:dolichol-phosphate mannosyltransferase
MSKLDLAIVMPVYNEEDCIRDVVTSWRIMLNNLNIKFRIIVLNDGSRDRTQEILSVFSGDECIEVINKKNSGHGPTILMGYHQAVQIADWVFQSDSDNEMKPEHFPRLWEKRGDFDALFGIRKDRRQSFSRKFITTFSRLAVYVLFGKGITDVNVPYRLIRSSILKEIIRQIPTHTLAPNLIISGVLSKTDVRIFETFIPYEFRQTGKVSIVKWGLWKLSMKAFWQILFCRPAIT